MTRAQIISRFGWVAVLPIPDTPWMGWPRRFHLFTPWRKKR